MKRTQKERVKNMPEYKMAPCDLLNAEEIGSGSNGRVVLVPDSHSPMKVIKFFSVDSSLSKAKRNERYKRFCREIETQKRLGDIIKGVLPVYDYSFPRNFVKHQPAWFMMPKADKLKINDNKKTVYKLYNMLELARIINEIHN